MSEDDIMLMVRFTYFFTDTMAHQCKQDFVIDTSSKHTIKLQIKTVWFTYLSL